FAKLGTLAAITQKTSSRFFELLEDTLIVNRLDAYAKSATKRMVRHPKFYFFDNGVLNGLLKNFTLSEDRKGLLFEHLIISQIITMNAVHGELAQLSTYRTEAGSEVDLIIERDQELVAIEIKSGGRLTAKNFHGLRRFSEPFTKKPRQILLYAGDRMFK